MGKFFNNLRQLKNNGKWPSTLEINSVFFSFSKREKILFLGFVFVLVFSTVAILENINKSFMVTVPLYGGSIREGIVGVPRFINPILAFSDADEDLVALVYSGLMRKDPNGNLIPDLAEKYDISKNGLVYTFTLKDNLTFQDGTKLKVEDILFTINKVKDSTLKSIQKINWDGVTVEKIDDKNIRFTLKTPYASFLKNTTLGIMPMHIWDGTPMELNTANTNPIGSGPYMVSKVTKESTGVISAYTLSPFKKFILSEPYIKTINMTFYANEEDMSNALINDKIDQISSITPLNAENLKERNFKIESITLPRVFGLFFNQNNNNLFVDKTVVRAINSTIDKDRIVKEVLLGYGVVIDDPIPPNIIEYQKLTAKVPTPRSEILQKVQSDLAKDGWKKGTDGFLEKTTLEKKKKITKKLQFSISTGNIPELTKAAELIKNDLKEVGMDVDIKTFETGNLNQSVIRPRKYDALLFGQIINNESDLFAFWHSSQRRDPGLNVAMYTNAKVDKILEDANITIDDKSRVNKYLQFEDEIRKDMPAVFLYSPDFIYVVSKNLNNFEINKISSPKDRYMNTYSWYIQTENVWKIFTK